MKTQRVAGYCGGHHAWGWYFVLVLRSQDTGELWPEAVHGWGELRRATYYFNASIWKNRNLISLHLFDCCEIRQYWCQINLLIWNMDVALILEMNIFSLKPSSRAKRPSRTPITSFFENALFRKLLRIWLCSRNMQISPGSTVREMKGRFYSVCPTCSFGRKEAE
jgi:hypothetical protein